MAAPNEITPTQLLRLIGTPECPVLIDVSVDADFDADPYLIPGARRHPHTDLDGLAAGLNGRACVVSCQKGLKLSQGVVALLRGRGIKAEYLSGGMYGWRDTPEAVRVPARTVPQVVTGGTLWVTRHRPKIDRIACPWLIRRFIDPAAQFMFVAPTQVLTVAERFNATPFDVEHATYTHVGSDCGSDCGSKCTFDALLDAFALETPALSRLANVVRAADTGALGDAPEAAGLLALSVGLSRQYKDDHTQLEAGMAIYDALYRWARDGQRETHASLQGAAR